MATKHYAMSATKKDRAGKGAARALRRENMTPAVIYGDKKAPITIAIPTKEANIEYNKAHMFTSICNMDVEGEKVEVLARDVQLHPVTDNVMHVDFLRVTDKTTITVGVPMSFINQEESEYSKSKGILNITRYSVDVVCKAKDIPDEIVVDVKDFKIGDSIKISNATMPAGAKPAIDDRDFTVATISAPRVVLDDEPEETEGEEGETAESAEAEKAEGGDEKPAEE